MVLILKDRESATAQRPVRFLALCAGLETGKAGKARPIAPRTRIVRTFSACLPGRLRCLLS